MPKKKLTDKTIQNLPKPKSGRVDYIDADSRGLVLRVSYTGAKSWSVVYRVLGEGGVAANGRELRGKQNRISLGSYPAISLADARKEALRISELTDQRIDPKRGVQEQALRRHHSTVERLANKMLDVADHSCTENQRRIFQNHVFPSLGNRPMESIRIAEVDALLDDLKADGKKGMATEVRKHLRTLFGWAKDRGIIEINIMGDYVRKDLAYKPRKRYLSDEELKAAWQAADSMSFPAGSMIKTLMLTGLRKSEVSKAMWTEVDAKNRGLILQASRSKNREVIFSPFSDMAWELLQEVPKQSGPYIFSTTGGEKPMWAGTKVADEFRKRCGEVEHFTMHDLRRTLRTRLSMLGVEPHIAERVINHAQGDKSQATYDHYAYIPERRDAVNRYASHLMEIVND